MNSPPITVRPLTSKRWHDLEHLFGARGACGGCWCMWWRLSHAEFERKKGASNKRSFRRVVESGTSPGLIAYRGHDPVGWCAVQPREAFPRLDRSRILQRIDDVPVWSIVCLFVAKQHRRSGLSRTLLEAAIKHARKHGARIVEGYPVEPKQDTMPDPFVWTGLASSFRAAGFREVARRSPTRPIMRYTVDNKRPVGESMTTDESDR